MAGSQFTILASGTVAVTLPKLPNLSKKKLRNLNRRDNRS